MSLDWWVFEGNFFNADECQEGFWTLRKKMPRLPPLFLDEFSSRCQCPSLLASCSFQGLWVVRCFIFVMASMASWNFMSELVKFAGENCDSVGETSLGDFALDC